MVNFEFNGKSFYIDGILKKQLDTKVLPELQKKDKDVVFIVDGKERSGKSKFADIVGCYAATFFKRPYDLSNVCLSPEEFRSRIQNAHKNDTVIYDEAHRGMGSRRALSEINNILVDLMMEMGQRNLFVIVVLPTFFMLDRYPALYRARGLFHIYEKKGTRGFWCYFNEKAKLKLYINGKKLLNYNCMRWPKFRGRFYNQFAVDEDAYREKKAKNFNDKPRITRAETYMDQRDKLLYCLYNEFGELSASKIRMILKKYRFPLKERTILEIIKKMREELGEIAVSEDILSDKLSELKKFDEYDDESDEDDIKSDDLDKNDMEVNG
jgi:hypothetical protein